MGAQVEMRATGTGAVEGLWIDYEAMRGTAKIINDNNEGIKTDLEPMIKAVTDLATYNVCSAAINLLGDCNETCSNHCANIYNTFKIYADVLNQILSNYQDNESGNTQLGQSY